MKKLSTSHLGGIFYSILIYGFFYLPILVLIIYSFNNAALSQIWHGFTLQWYYELFHDHTLLQVAKNSLLIAFSASTLATLLGTLASVTLYRYRFFGRQLLHGLLFILAVSPDIVMGISLLILFNFLKIKLGLLTLLLAHSTFCIPFVAITIYSRLLTINKTIFEAAKDLGANDFVIFYRIMLPLLLPAIFAGWLLSFTLSMDDVIISFFVTGPQFEILPLRIYSLVRLGLKPEINALCSIMFITTLSLIILAQIALKRKNTFILS